MLGRRVLDPRGVDGPAGAAEGLGLLDVETTMVGEKTVRRACGRCALTGAWFLGYYLRGLFSSDVYRRAWLERAGACPGSSWNYEMTVDAALDEIAADLSGALDVDALFAAAR